MTEQARRDATTQCYEAIKLHLVLFEDGLKHSSARARSQKSDELKSTSGELCQPGSTDCGPALYPATSSRYGELPKEDPTLGKSNARQAPDSPPAQTGRGYQTQQRIVMFGDDFAYTNATVWYSQMDMLIDTINSMNGSHYYAFYSTPECYLRSVHEQWFRRKKGPSGERALLQRRLHAILGPKLRVVDGLLQQQTATQVPHTPGVQLPAEIRVDVSQVCRQVTALLNVMEDSKIQKLGVRVAARWSPTSLTASAQRWTVVRKSSPRPSTILATISTSRVLLPKFCRKLNQSECPPSESLERFYVTVYNPQSVMVKTHVRFPVATSGYRVVNDQKAFVPSEIIPIQHALFHIPERNSTSFHDLVFLATVPPLGVSTFLVQRFRGATFLRQQIKATERVLSAGTDYILKNKWYSVAVDSSSCLLKRVSLLGQNQHVSLEQSFAGYSSEYGHVLFAPKEAKAEEFRANATCRLVTSTIVQEVHQWFTPWLSQVIRLYVDQDYIEFDWIAGPIPTT
ncbi:hypothetical protein MRX96_010734 [Rhipicephalus microplus]